ncbi:hypothetical protein BC834DRAFT_391257 [Gloeopeniophorella convolvens]|nr:hypothetical protein BC834DRAFT_391257 [Gloeopeniophorella convolvens]
MSSTDGNTDIFALSTDESHTSATDPFAISRAASGASEDVDAKSDGFISFPGTPVGDGEFSFWDDGDPAVASPRASQGPIFSEPQTPIDGGRSEAQFPTFDDRSQAQASKSEPVSDDTSCPVKGMYPLLDLITEQGSSGLVDKIIIAQRPLQAFINALSPGAYSSITKVNFKTLDNSVLKPVGIYGSKEEIVRFLREINAVDEGLARKLLTPQSVYMSGAEPILRSGLYVVRSFTAEAEEQVYVLYWPEDTTWDDHAVSTIQRNRVTFMRYLTKLCDQLVCLISSEHSRAIVWSDDDDDDASINSENDDSDRMYYFEVAKTTDQEENVTARQGFMMNSPLIGKQVAPTKLRFDPEILKPKLLHSETAQGFMTARFRPAKVLRDEFRHDHQNASQIRLLFKDDATFCLSDGLEDSSLKTLQDLVLEARFPKECEAWQARRKEISKRFQKTFTARRGEMHIALEESSASIKAKLQVAVVREIARVFT